VNGVNFLTVKQNTLRQGGLSRIDVRANPDVSHSVDVNAHKMLLYAKNTIVRQNIARIAKKCNPSQILRLFKYELANAIFPLFIHKPENKIHG